MNLKIAALCGAAAALAALTLSTTTASAAGDDSLRARLAAVEDRLAIEQLLIGDYPRALDSSDWHAYAALFAPDGELSAGGMGASTKGRQAIEDYFNKAFAGRPPRTPSAIEQTCPYKPGGHHTEHVISNWLIHIDGDTATDQAYWQTIVSHDCQSMVAGAGHYEDVLKKIDGHWYFAKRAIIDDLPPRKTPPTAPAAGAAPPAPAPAPKP
jgi:uncharacterized protein (TIGR02246 family)